MAITRVGSNTGNSIPAGFQAGDLLLYAVQSNGSVSTPSGWANVTSSPVIQTEYTYLFYKIAAGGDADPTSLGTFRAVIVYRGVDQTTPIRATGVNSNNFATTANATINSVPADNWLVLIGGASNAITATEPSGFTQLTAQNGSFRSLETSDTNGAPGAGNYTKVPTWASAKTIRTILVDIAVDAAAGYDEAGQGTRSGCGSGADAPGL